ncbi:MAG TPA: type ISP restriction/modification enzyme [Chloroflexia bacterium]|nr:type ISP restriction/modification enzyme [Chloroflexia bacterium]
MPPALPKPFAAYYSELAEYGRLGASNEGATRAAFQKLLADIARPRGLSLLGEQTIAGTRKRSIRVDGLLVDEYKLWRGIWEAKDTADDLPAAISQKIADGYPLDNTLFENTRQAVLYQNGSVALQADMAQPSDLQRLLDEFLSHTRQEIDEFHTAVAEFRRRIPELAAGLTEIIDAAKRDNPRFLAALEGFLLRCRDALNPATTQAEVEDMLKQHILTERIFRGIFNNPDFVRRNAVAVELEKMVSALTSRSFSRDTFFKKLDYFYLPIEEHARTIEDYEQKQSLLNTLYEQFFQAYSTRAADTHGIVYTPREIVQWMVNSVEEALKREFGLSLSSSGVHIIDPCVGTGTFMMELLRRIPTSVLDAKYQGELHANEVLLLPYYIAAQNIEHEYYERTGNYAPFDGICFVDTLNMEKLQYSMFAPENTERIAKQNAAPIRVIIGNPPYNVGQVNENDNNKNRRHDRVDERIRQTFVAASQATLHTKLYDMYVKFFRWAIDRLDKRDGVVCFVSNNGFLDGIAFDGFRSHLLRDFTRIYHFNFKGNARTSGERRRQEGGNIFNDQIRTGVGITLLIRKAEHEDRVIFYHEVGDYWKVEKKREYLRSFGNYADVMWQILKPDARNNWLTEGMSADFTSFVPMGTKETKEAKWGDVAAIFKTYSLGVSTNRDVWVYNFQAEELAARVQAFIDAYNEQVFKWTRRGASSVTVDNFVAYDSERLKWSESLKRDLERGALIDFSTSVIRKSLYRPFTKKFIYFADSLVDRKGTTDTFFPTLDTEHENSLICASRSNSKAFHALMCNTMPDLHVTGDTLCFPFYTYDEDGTNRRENITDWALAQFREHYADPAITKHDIFHYVYAVLHSPEYRAKYAKNLKRDLPRIPYVPPASFRAYVQAGERLAALHRDYETVQPYPLERKEDRTKQFNWRVEKMQLSADRTSLRYNPALTLAGIPPEVYRYRLGNRSALEWVVDQYRVTKDPRSGIESDPYNPSDPQAIVRLVECVVRVSVETVAIVEGLPGLGTSDQEVGIMD